MKVGFTGTRHGMTTKQQNAVRHWLSQCANGMDGRMEFHHGVCVGADAEAHQIAKSEGYFIVGYPSTASTRSVLTEQPHEFETLAEPKAPLDRNMDIVDACDVLIAAPRQREEEQRSGTWHAIRYARKVGRTTIMVWP